MQEQQQKQKQKKKQQEASGGGEAPLSLELETLSVQELQEQLRSRGVDFSDCFDRESLMERARRHMSNSKLE
eukprot:scaffold1667_cov258-Pinguiococcus_pyrenoidosus.AAC.23